MLPLALSLDDKNVPPTDPIDAALSDLGLLLADHPSIRFEWALRAGPKSIARNDRCIVWVDGTMARHFDVVAQVLRAQGAASVVLERQAELANDSVSQGLSLARRGNRVEWSLYVHHRDPITRADRYEAWAAIGPSERGGKTNPEKTHYEFSFLPETPAGITPASVVESRLVPLVQMLCEHSKFAPMSGFWLRHRRGIIDRLDLTAPWHPPLSEIDEPLRAACASIDAPTDWLDEYTDHGFRHIGLTTSSANDGPGIVVYFSAPRAGSWPRSIEELRKQVHEQSAKLRQSLARNYLETMSTPRMHSSALDTFYGASNLEPWTTALGPELHYHHGIYDPNPEPRIPDANELQFAAQRAVRELYPWISKGARVYDLGCGWGSPALMLRQEHGCRVLGVTISRAQYRHCAARGLSVRYADMEETLPPGRFDCAFLLESFSHVRDKPRLLRALRHFCGRLVMRVNCQDAAPTSANFAGTMHMISSTNLRLMLEQAGWSVIHWHDRRSEAIPTVSAWRERISLIGKTTDHHFETFRHWTRHVIRGGQSWVVNNPLIEVVAVPAT